MITSGRPPAPLEHSDEEEGLEPWEVGLGHCETAEGPYVLQEMITDEPPPPPVLEPAATATRTWSRGRLSQNQRLVLVATRSKWSLDEGTV